MSHRTSLGGRTTLDNRTEIGGRIELGPFGANPLLNLITRYGVPAFLFDNTEVFQDAAGLTPSAIGDVIGNDADQSGGSHDITQSVTAAKPQLLADRIVSYDGDDDELVGVNPYTGDEITLMWCGVFPVATTANETVISFGDSTDNANYFFLFSTATSQVQFFATGLGDANMTHPALTTTKSIITVRISGTTGTLRVNGIAGAAAVTTQLDLSQVDIFTHGSLRRTTPSTYGKQNTDYSFSINKSVTDAEMVQAEEYIAGLCGVTLP